MWMKRPGNAWPFSHGESAVAGLLSGRFAAPVLFPGDHHEEKAT
jgi:hypothetical protein